MEPSERTDTALSDSQKCYRLLRKMTNCDTHLDEALRLGQQAKGRVSRSLRSEGHHALEFLQANT
jgi:hypothetical protein